MSAADSFIAQSSAAYKKTKNVFDALDSMYRRFHEEKTALVIVIDEFGKFLEYAAEHNPEQELYFIQQLAEYVNDSSKNILLLTTLHQGFDSYARGLDMTQRQEWEKVKGRLKEFVLPLQVPELCRRIARADGK